MNLTEFLLARIAEDEHEHRAWTDGTEGDEPTCYEDSKPYPCRVIAECEAKRRIVNNYQAHAAMDLTGDPIRCGMYVALGEALIDLASPYADHPDYREEWKS